MRFLLLFCLIFLPVSASDSGERRPTRLHLNLELDRGVLYVRERQRAVIKVGVTAPVTFSTRERERAPVAVAFVIDVSGSMQGKKMENAKAAVLEALDRMDKDDYAALIAYSDTAKVLVPLGPVGKGRDIRRAVLSLVPDGRTALFGGVSLGAAELRKAGDKIAVNRLILLSDGIANVGPSSPMDLERLGRGLSKEGFTVSTLGYGSDYNEDLMTRLSQSSEGNTYFVEAYNDLPEIFQRELGSAFSVYARDLQVRLRFPNNVKPISVLGREARIQEDEVVLRLPQINAEQEKYVFVEVEVLSAGPNEERILANAEVRYQPIDSKSELTERSSVKARFSLDESVVYSSSNTDVISQNMMLSNTFAADEAVGLADSGKHTQAAERLRKAAEDLEKVGVETNDGALLLKAEEMRQYAARIEAGGLTNLDRKRITTDNYQTQIQQKKEK